MLRDLLRLFVSNPCQGCGQALTAAEPWICLNCLGQMEATGFQYSPQANDLYYRLAGRIPLEGAASLYYFDKGGRLQRIIKALKYANLPELGVHLGQLAGEQWKGSPFLAQTELLVPMPLHPWRQRQRGYNQSEEIAKGLSDVLGLPVDNSLVRRIRRTKTQTRKSAAARWANVKEAFEATPNAAGRRLLLVDDIITTGSTLEACIKALYASEVPPAAVSVCSIGLARGH